MLSAKEKELLKKRKRYEIEVIKCEAKRMAGLIHQPLRVSTPFEKGAKFCGIVEDRFIDVWTELEEPVLKEKPKGCHGTCRNFNSALYGTGSCGLNKSPVAPDKVGCRDWESTGSDRLFAEVVNKRAKYLAGV